MSRSVNCSKSIDGLRDGGLRRREYRCPVVAEHNVERLGQKRQPFRIALNNGDTRGGRLGKGTCVSELLFREIEAYGSRTLVNQGKRPLRGPATQFKDVTSFELPENAQLRFWNSPHAPSHCALRERPSMGGLVRIAGGIPKCAIRIG